MKAPTIRLPASARSLAVKAYLRALAASKRHVMIGPMRSELGFEVLYWLPFLHWALKYAGIPTDRCTAISRGGMGVFYPAGKQVDLYDLRGVDAVRLENKADDLQRGLMKQTSVTAWDRQVCADAAAQLKVGKFAILHPSWMYWLFDHYWQERVGMRHIEQHAHFSVPAIPNLPEGCELPPQFIAVRFYERHTLPLNPGTVPLIEAMVRQIAAHWPVVLLNQSVFADDHTDLPLGHIPNVFSLPAIPPSQNFILQAAVLARSQAFVGTYGGVAQWALRYRKPSLSFYTDFKGTAVAHRSLSQHLSAAQGVPFEVCDMKALKLWQMSIPQMALNSMRASSLAVTVTA